MNKHLDKALELARYARVNLKNVSDAIPLLASHPIFLIAASQLDGTIKELELSMRRGPPRE